jgi:phospholipid/cholesterol/gamma-HCH transport system substrate-binding protein
MLPTISSALETGVPVLRRTPAFNAQVRDTLSTLRDLAEAPTTNMALRALTDTVGILNPVVRFLGPYQTVCNYWNYTFTYLAEQFSAKDKTGMAQRVLVNTAPPQRNGLELQGAYEPANATHKTAEEENYPTFPLFPGIPTGLAPFAPQLATLPPFFPDIPENEIPDVLGDPSVLHGQPYGAAINNDGRADCESGQRGYPTNRLKIGGPTRDTLGHNRFQTVSDPHTPGNQGTTFEGRSKVPKGETFSRDPEWPRAAQLPDALSTGTYGGW